MARSSKREIPQELVYHVVEQLSGDAKSLQNCSLVSHSWLATARPTLLRSVKVRPERIRAFVADLDKTPAISTYVRSVSLIYGTSRLDDILDMLVRLPRLRNLRLIALTLLPFSRSTRLLRLPLTEPHCLTLCRCNVATDNHLSWHHLFNLVGLFSFIREFRLTTMEQRYPPDRLEASGLIPPISPSTRIESLSFYSEIQKKSRLEELVQIMTTSLDLRGLTSIVFQSSAYVPVLEKIWQHADRLQKLLLPVANSLLSSESHSPSRETIFIPLFRSSQPTRQHPLWYDSPSL